MTIQRTGRNHYLKACCIINRNSVALKMIIIVYHERTWTTVGNFAHDIIMGKHLENKNALIEYPTMTVVGGSGRRRKLHP